MMQSAQVYSVRMERKLPNSIESRLAKRKVAKDLSEVSRRLVAMLVASTKRKFYLIHSRQISSHEC